MKRGPKPKPEAFGKLKATTKLRKVWHDRNYRLEFGGNVWVIDVAQWSEPDNPERGELRVYRVEGDINNQALFDRAMLRLAKHRNLYLITEEWGSAV